MGQMKNICGKIPVELHEKVRLEIESTESSTQKFIQQVIEEHFMRKGEMSMATTRTVAVQISEELFSRLKGVLMKKGCKQKDFLLAVIEQAIEAEEAKWKQTEEPEPETEEETDIEEAEEGEEKEAEPEELETETEEESGNPETEETEECETDVEEAEEQAEPENPEETEE